MNLYFLRHGIALAQDDPTVGLERDRPLSRKGVKRVRKAARGLFRLAIPFDVILTSPALRARQTAEIVASALGMETSLEEISGLAPESSMEHLLFGLTRYQDRQHLLLVGHEPLLSATARYLLCGKQSQSLELVFKKGSLCHVEVESLSTGVPGKLHFLLTPKQLRSIA